MFEINYSQLIQHEILEKLVTYINQHLTICRQMLKIWCNHLFFLHCCEKISVLTVYSLPFNLEDFNWPQEQSTSIRYLWSKHDSKLFVWKKDYFFSVISLSEIPIHVLTWTLLSSIYPFLAMHLLLVTIICSDI